MATSLDNSCTTLKSFVMDRTSPDVDFRHSGVGVSQAVSQHIILMDRSLRNNDIANRWGLCG